MHVGINYPWFDYGWDFGLAPPTWRSPDAAPNWCRAIDADLDHFRSLGISVVRWFVLGDGLTYGAGRGAPRLDRATATWRFEPGPLSAEFLRHFRDLLARFANANQNDRAPVQLLPVFVDFGFCDPGIPIEPVDAPANHDWVKCGRADALTDRRKRRAFLDHVLDPLLRVSRECADAIYAWELINEPEWVTTGWHLSDVKSCHPIGEPAMRAFLEDGRRRVQQAGFKSTIGFASRFSLDRSQIACEIDQFHYYAGGIDELPEPSGRPAIVGELATAAADVWPGLAANRQDLFSRLQHMNRLGYPLAIPWSFRQRDRHSHWTRAAAAAVERFTLST